MANCTVADGILSPCPGLGRALQDHDRKGVSLLELYNFEEGRTSRTGAVLRSGTLGKNGAIMNYCPFCGSPIGDHFMPKEEPANG